MIIACGHVVGYGSSLVGFFTLSGWSTVPPADQFGVDHHSTKFEYVSISFLFADWVPAEYFSTYGVQMIIWQRYIRCVGVDVKHVPC